MVEPREARRWASSCCLVDMMFEVYGIGEGVVDDQSSSRREGE